MNFRIFTVFILIAAICLSFVACGGGGSTDADSVNDSMGDTSADTLTENVDTNTETDNVGDSETAETEASRISMAIGENDISSYSIFCSDDAVAGTIADHLAERIMTLSGFDIPAVTDVEAAANTIIIEDNAELGEDEFIIYVEDGDLHISYAVGASAYQAVTAVLDDTLFSVNGSYALASDFTFSGMCGDYVIGDNEFNPFE